jgi:ATP-binding cassette, subfamily G (WHITE), member 2, SNQ2
MASFVVISSGLIVGSLFNGQSLGTDGAFSRGGAILFSIVFLSWLQMSELAKTLSGRTIIARHIDYALYRPFAVCTARVLVDIPTIFVQALLFTVIMYFLTDLDLNAAK